MTTKINQVISLCLLLALAVSCSNNLLTLYLIFEKDLKTTLTAKVFDKNGLEEGRAKIEISGNAGEASYYDFSFDKRTYIEVKSKIILE
jgi:hypothetical protein